MEKTNKELGEYQDGNDKAQRQDKTTPNVKRKMEAEKILLLH